MSRPIPPKHFLERLENEIGQAWFDGAKSVVDTRFNNSSDRLPLWVITFWKRMAEVVEKQETWRKTFSWLDREERQTQDTQMLQTIKQARDMLAHLGWNSKLPLSRHTQTTILLTTLLSTAWLSDEHIDMMVEELSNEIASDSKLLKKPIIAPLAFSVQLEAAEAAGHTTSRKNPILLSRYEKHIKEAGIEELYFPAHVRKNHWIAGLVDFKQHVIRFGEFLIV